MTAKIIPFPKKKSAFEKYEEAKALFWDSELDLTEPNLVVTDLITGKIIWDNRNGQE